MSPLFCQRVFISISQTQTQSDNFHSQIQTIDQTPQPPTSVDATIDSIGGTMSSCNTNNIETTGVTSDDDKVNSLEYTEDDYAEATDCHSRALEIRDMPTRQNLSSAAIERHGAGTSDAGGGGENTTRGCSYKEYKEFLICKPQNFNGTEGALGLTRWFEKMESVFRMCECSENHKVLYATSTLLDVAFTWWNFYAQSIGIDAAYQTSWNDLKKMMTEMYCPRMEIRDMPTTRQNLSSAAIERHIAHTAYEANRNSGDGVGTTDVAGGGENSTHGCSYKNFLKCKPQNFNGTEGALGLIGWFAKMESVFRICECAENCKVLYATGTLLDDAFTWWNFYARSIGSDADAACQTSWNDLKKKMTEMYCPRYELRSMEFEFSNLSVKGTDIVAYTNRFQELALLCPTMVTPEYKKIERYISGLTPDIEGKVASSKPTTIQSAICMAHDLMDQVVRVKVARNADNKRKWDDNQKGNSGQQQNKRREVVRAYAAGQVTRKGMLELYPNATSASFTIMDLASLNVGTTRRSVTKQVII